MNPRGYGKLRFAAVSVLVVLALTGFSTGKSRVHKSHGDDSGGGCSSSGQDHDGTSTSGGTTSSGGSSGGSSVAPQDAEVELVDCATKTEPYATLTVHNPNSGGDYFTVTVDFLDADSQRVEQRSTDEYVAGNDTATVHVGLSSPGLAAKVDHCAPERSAPPS